MQPFHHTNSALLQSPALTDPCINSPTVSSLSIVPPVHSLSTELQIHPTPLAASTVEAASQLLMSSQATQNDCPPVSSTSSKFAVD